MLKIEIGERGADTRIAIDGSIETIVTDMSLAIRLVYGGLCERDANDAEIFRKSMEEVGTRGSDMNDEIFKRLREKKKVKEELKELLESLKELAETLEEKDDESK